MRTRIPPRWIDPGIEGNERERTHPRDRFGESGQAESAIPDDPLEQRRVRNRLIALTLTVPVAQLLRLLFR